MDAIKQIIGQIKEVVAVLKAFKEVKIILAKVAEDLKAPIHQIAIDIDELIVALQESENTFDDKLIPALETLSAWLRKISA